MSLSRLLVPLPTLAARLRVARPRASTRVGAVALVLLTCGVPHLSAQSPGHLIVTPADLKWADVPSLPPGAQLAVIEGSLASTCTFTVRLRFPANYRIPPHWHSAVERVTVLAGKFHLGMGSRFDTGATTPMGPGAVAVMMPQMTHFVWITEDTIVQLHGTGPWSINYIETSDDPRNAPSQFAASRRPAPQAEPAPQTGCLTGR